MSVENDPEFIRRLTALVNDPTMENEGALIAYVDALIKD